ncbi:family 43 glycosylhydrolase [Paenibacillus harenae]|nr:family 43 glycosylhydrolase [Paenibacillus harenae]
MRKRLSIVMLAVTLLMGLLSNATTMHAQDEGEGTFDNPLIWADVPDPDVIRVGDVYYMSSTTMHMNPGVPIMRSYDLVNWEIVNYVYDILAGNDEQALRNGSSNYGQGSWASSLRYHEGIYYVAFASYDTGKTYIYQTEDIEKGPWTSSSLDGVYHDMSLLFDDDGRVYMVYGGGDIRVIELTSDATAIKPGGMNKVIIPDASLVAGPNVGLKAEGAHIQKINGYYYVFTITWPTGGMRTELVHRADAIDGTYTGQVALRDAGIAQGGIIDTVDGKWYGLLFGDRGAVGRIPYLVPVTWEENWPVFGVDGKVPLTMAVPIEGAASNSQWVASDEFYQSPNKVGASHTVFENDSLNGSLQPLAGSIDDLPAAAIEPLASTNEGQELLVNGGFEVGQEPWTGHDNVTVAVSINEAYSGTNSLFISNRGATGSGPQQSLAGKLKAGGIYAFSVKVKYDGDSAVPATKQFNIAYQDGNWQTIKVLGSATITKGTWGTIEGTYTVPEDAALQSPLIFIETVWTSAQDPVKDRMDFYVDDVSFRDVTPDSNLLVNGGFENGTEPWTGHQNAEVSATNDEAYSGSSSLFITGREGTGSGPQHIIAGKVKAGGVYKFSAKVKYNGDSAVPATKPFNLAFQDGDWTTIKVMGSGTITKGQWGTIEGTYTIPEDLELKSPLIFIETVWTSAQDPVKDRMDFYVDDVRLEDVTPAGGLDGAQPGEYDDNGSNLALAWQWNHNPDNRNWSLTERPGHLRLTTGRKSTNLLDSRNTLTQRTFGPESSGSIAIDVSKMKNGDYAGLAALQAQYGYVGVKMDGNAKSIVMVDGSSGSAVEVEQVPLTQDRVYFKTEMDFKNQTDKAYFYYSLDGIGWTSIGSVLQMRYTLPHFMGYRFALFNYATKTTGGYVDFDYFRIDGEMTGEGASAAVLKAELGDVDNVIGVPNIELDVPVTMDALPAGAYESIEGSFNIPKELEVTGVTFNADNISGNAAFDFADQRLRLQVTGENVNFTSGASDLFATIHLKVASFVPTDKTVLIETDYIQAEGGDVVYNVHDAAADIHLKALNTEAIAKLPGYSNPLMDYKLGADPHALVYDGRVYIYMSSDEYEYDANGNVKSNSFSNLNRVFVISSDDMVNWTDHGAIPVAGANGIAKWANFSWAPAAAHKVIDGQDKFFLYFANGAGGIGVLTADSPIGPWTDPLGKALITGSTPGVPGVVWLFDPAVLVDDDGKGYLYFGGGIPGGNNPTQEQVANPRTGRVMELGDDMISTVGSAVLIDAPFLFEDSGIHKYNGKYYYSYCSNFSGTHPEGTPPKGEIAYMVSDSPMGPFTYVSPILKNPSVFFGVGGNNHHSIFEFDDEWYVVYHAQTVSRELLGDGMGYRSPHINKVEIYESGAIKDIKGDMEGISQLKDLDPFVRTEAETIAWNAGILTAKSDAPGAQVESLNLHVTDIEDGDWIAAANADFGDSGATTFQANVRSSAGGSIEIRLDSPLGEVVGTLEVPAGGEEPQWQLLETDIAPVTGVYNLFFMFKGAGTDPLFDFDYWSFEEGDVIGCEVIPVESATIVSSTTAIKVNEQITVGSAITPCDATDPVYRWEARGSMAIVGDADKDTVVIKGLSKGMGTLSLSVTAGGAEVSDEMEFTVISSGGGNETPTPTPTPTPTATPTPTPTPTPKPTSKPTSTPSPTPTEDGNDGVDIIVNGKPKGAGTVVHSNRNGQSVTTVSLDPVKLEQWIATEEGTIITIPVTKGADVVIGELNGQLMKDMAGRKAVLELKTDNVTYIVPAERIDIEAIASELGVSTEDLHKMNIQLEIAEPTAAQLQAAENAANQGGFTVVIPPVAFTVRAVIGEKTAQIERFNDYVERLIAIPDNIDPNFVTTAVIIEEDGRVRHVPTKIVTMDGKRYAQVSSVTNSMYALIGRQATFTDVEGHWAKEAVNELGSRFIVSGKENGLFLPNLDMTRAEFAAIIVRALGLKPAEGSSVFSDVKAGTWYSSAVTAAHAYGLIGGFKDGTFRPSDKITREQAMVILAKAMELTGLKAKLAGQSPDQMLSSYEDATMVSDWAKAAIASSIEAGIVTGRNATTLAPQAFITRAEVAIIVQRLLQKSDLT